MKKLQLLSAAVAIGLSVFAAGAANAAYPEDKDITVIIPKNPGGGTDITARGLITMMPCQIGLAVILNEVRVKRSKKFIQTAVTFPHFISWVVLAGIVNFHVNVPSLNVHALFIVP